MVKRILLLVMISAVLGCNVGDNVLDKSEVMPRFPGCESQPLPDDESRFYCSVERLMGYLGQDLKYPEAARAKGTSGQAVVQFIVKEDGLVEFVKIVEDPGDGLGDEAARMVMKMVDQKVRWRPGYQDGKPVAVRFNLPVKFDPTMNK